MAPVIKRISTSLPEHIKEFRWRRNSHWIELEDDEGTRTKLHAMSLVKGECADCRNTFYVESNIGNMRCPHCTSNKVQWQWGQGQLAFIPEDNGAFVPASLEAESGDDEN